MPRYLIAIATYQRQEKLSILLTSLFQARGVSDAADIVIVDNDPGRSALSTVASHELATQYICQPVPGIAAARNAALQLFSNQYAGIIFIDDDEWVAWDWFEKLTAYAEKSAAGAVQGAVFTVLTVGAPKWIVQGNFYQRRVRSTGETLESAATNNTLLHRSAWVRAGSPKFDEAFSLTGGSDWDLFWQVRTSGFDIHYCAEAVVSEEVPAERATWRWLRRRYLRKGMVGTRIVRKHGGSTAKYLGTAVVAIMWGVLQQIGFLLVREGVQAVAIERIFVNLGKFGPLLGITIEEYKR